MKLLLKNADIYTPEHIGIADILVEDGIIVKIGKNLTSTCQTIDCKNKIICPMLVDGHEHLLGDYWDEDGLIEAGVGSLVCCLADEQNPKCVDKIIEITNRLTKEYNIDAFCLAGSKNYTQDTKNYIINNKNVIGIKTALFQPQRPKPNLSYQKLKADAVSTYEAGEQTKKNVQVHIHLDHPFSRGEQVSAQQIDTGSLDNLGWIDQIVAETDIPYSIFKLTHAQKYYNRILEYANKGCYIDYTAFNGAYDKRFDPLVNAIKNKTVDLSKISISSDLGIMAMEKGNLGKESPSSLLNTVRELVNKGLPLETILPFVTTNPAKLMNQNCGKIAEGQNLKILILNQSLSLESVIINSQIKCANCEKNV